MSDIIKVEDSNGIDTQALITKAIEMNLDIDKMERILAMRRELKAEFSREAYFQALSTFQKECPVIEKKKIVKDKSGNTRYKFAPLDEIVQQISETLEKHGFSYTIKTAQGPGYVTAICYAHHKQGHFEQTEFTVPIDPDAYMSPAQKTASALTYAKRYAFCDAFGIMTGDEDNDANTGNPDGKPEPEKNKKPTDKPASPELSAAGAKIKEWIKAHKERFLEAVDERKKVSAEFMAFVTAKDEDGAIKYAEKLPVFAEAVDVPPVDAEKMEIFGNPNPPAEKTNPDLDIY